MSQFTLNYRRWSRRIPTLAAAFCTVCLFTAKAADWPQWRGPNRDGISAEQGWSSSWKAEGPKLLWESSVGIGFSTFVVAEGVVITTGNANETDTIYAFEAETGKLKWKHSYPAALMAKYFEGGTTGTPTIHEGKVYQLSRWSDLIALDLHTGKVIWQKNLEQETHLKTPEWGYSGAPVVYKDWLILNIGATGVAVQQSDGRVVWKSKDGDASYSTPNLYTHEGKDYAVLGRKAGYVGVELETGKEVWSIPWNTNYGINAADVILDDGHIFISTGYNKGAAYFPLGKGELKEIWKNREMRCQMNGVVRVGDFVYGPDGDLGKTGSNLKCMNFRTGEVKWEITDQRASAVTVAGDRLLVMCENGQLMVLKVNPEKPEVLASAQLLTGRCWSVPVLSNGLLFVRNAAGVVRCYDLRNP